MTDERPWFPLRLSIGHADITLHADGSWEGSANDLRYALIAGRNNPPGIADSAHLLLLWLLLRKLEHDVELG